MNTLLGRKRKVTNLVAALLTLTISTGPMMACSSSEERRMPPPPVDDTISDSSASSREMAPHAEEKQGMSGRKKLVILAGAAALYYLYKKHQNAKAEHGPESQYYLSKNGRVYYRDAEGRAHWVTPPPGGIQVPEHEAMEYRQFQGFNGQADGMDLQELAQSAGVPYGSGG